MMCVLLAPPAPVYSSKAMASNGSVVKPSSALFTLQPTSTSSPALGTIDDTSSVWGGRYDANRALQTFAEINSSGGGVCMYVYLIIAKLAK